VSRLDDEFPKDRKEDPVSVTANRNMPAPGDWTTDDLDALPEDGRRRELIDGVLIVSPSPTSYHQILALRLGGALLRTCPDWFHVTQGVEVRVNPRRTFIPDVLVVKGPRPRPDIHLYQPAEMALAIEIVSPGTKRMDRVRKPALYAAAGIPLYWYIETDGGVAVHTFRLDDGEAIYRPTGTFTDAIEVDEPWKIRLPIADVTP
jgi:Uma2 family endonuclease